MASPVISDVTVCMIWLPVETADTSVGAPNCPTTIRSTAPYMACRNRAASTGRANLKSLERILPSVKSAVFSIVSSSLIFCIPPETPKQEPSYNIKSRIKYQAVPWHLIQLCKCVYKPSDELFPV